MYWLSVPSLNHTCLPQPRFHRRRTIRSGVVSVHVDSVGDIAKIAAPRHARQFPPTGDHPASRSSIVVGPGLLPRTDLLPYECSGRGRVTSDTLSPPEAPPFESRRTNVRRRSIFGTDRLSVLSVGGSTADQYVHFRCMGSCCVHVVELRVHCGKPEMAIADVGSYRLGELAAGFEDNQSWQPNT
jgi:hypothetical protein